VTNRALPRIATGKAEELCVRIDLLLTVCTLHGVIVATHGACHASANSTESVVEVILNNTDSTGHSAQIRAIFSIVNLNIKGDIVRRERE